MPTQNTWNNTIAAAAVTLNGGVTSIGTDAAANAINIGTGGAAKTITIGNVIGATAVQINAGSGASAINTTNAPFTLNTGTGTIGLGGDAVAKAISVGNTTGASNLTLKCGTSGCSVVSATGNIIVAPAAGHVTMPLQPVFLATLNGSANSVTGDGTNYTITWGRVIYDINSNVSGTTFTAPVTGKYLFATNIGFSGLVAASNSFFQITTTARSYLVNGGIIGVLRNASNQYSYGTSTIADMSAGDTAVITVQVAAGTKTVTILDNGATDPRTWWSGTLLC